MKPERTMTTTNTNLFSPIGLVFALWLASGALVCNEPREEDSLTISVRSNGLTVHVLARTPDGHVTNGTVEPGPTRYIKIEGEFVTNARYEITATVNDDTLPPYTAFCSVTQRATELGTAQAFVTASAAELKVECGLGLRAVTS